jgi:protein-tyrosine-phosphatase
MAGPTSLKRLLFICNENCNRSQMAEAFARLHGAGRVEAYSAGRRPAAVVHPKAIAAMREVGYDMKAHYPKGLSDIPAIKYDVVVTIGDDDQCPGIEAGRREHWQVPVPKDLPAEQFRSVRDQIAARVTDLVARLELLEESQTPEVSRARSSS